MFAPLQSNELCIVSLGQPFLINGLVKEGLSGGRGRNSLVKFSQ